jgi:hypothetical protein
MARSSKPYADGGTFKPQVELSTEWLEPGFYKVRAWGGGPWVPIRITMADGDRDPETWELLSDQTLEAEWWPQTNNTQSFSVNPRRFFARAFPIDRSEFEWLITLRQIRR